MYTDRGHEKGDYPRVCDFCGHRWMFKQLVQKEPLRFACPDCAPGLTANQISRYNAKARPVRIRPRKYAKDYIQTPIYQLAEGALFNFIAKAAPADDIDGSAACLPAAWACIYMADIVIQNKRPQIWIDKAKLVIATCAQRLLSKQAGGGINGYAFITKTDTRWGGITDDVATGDEFSTATWSTETTISGGLAFIKAYQATGTLSYLEGARRCAQYLRHVQCKDKAVDGPTAFRTGGFAATVSDLTTIIEDKYIVGDILGAWFLTIMAEVEGADAEFGDASSIFFTGSTLASLTTMLSELRAFAETGVPDSVNSGANTPGLSATSPRLTYTVSGGTWGTEYTLSTDSYARAVLGIYGAFGLTDQVTGILSMLASLTPNPANTTPAGTTDAALYAGLTGDFDPTLAPPIYFTTELNSDPFTDVAGSVYDWASLGLLSPALSSNNPGTFRTSKDALSTAHRYAVDKIDAHYLSIYGYSGYSFQTSSFGRSVTLAAKAGMAYRQDPGRYPLLRGN